MQRLGRNDVLVTPVELSEMNKTISYGYIRLAMSRNNNGTLKTWQHELNSANNRLIKYSSIPDKFKAKYNLPTTQQLIDRIITNDAVDKADQKQLELELKEDALTSAIRQAAQSDYARYCPQYVKCFPNKTDKAITYAKTHSVLLACISLKVSYKVAELHRAYLQTKGIKNTLTNPVKFGQMLVRFAKEGINLVDKRTGKTETGATKVTDFHRGKMEEYRMHPNQYTYQRITELVNENCREAKLKEISIESVSQYLRQPEVKNRLSYYYNKSYYRKNVKPHSRRRTADYAGDEYYADGSPLQIFCWNKERSAIVRLNLFVVMDLHSKKIVGFDLAENEDRYNWFAAFKMAFSMEKLLPYNVVYDNASATKTDEFMALKAELLLKGCHMNAAKKGNPQAKAQVERWFETFQSGFQRMIDGFIGEGIKSRRDNGRIDAEYLKKVQTERGHYNYETMVSIVTELIGIYNQKPVSKRKAANKMFAESDKPNARPIGVEDIAMLFWMHKVIKVFRAEVKFEIRHNPYYYEVFNHDLALKLNGQQVKVYYDERDLSTVQIFTLANEYLGELRQKISIVSAMANQKEADILNIIKVASHNESLPTVIDKTTRGIASQGRAVNPNAFAVVLDPFTSHKEQFNCAETELMQYYIDEQKEIDRNKVAEYEPVLAGRQSDGLTVQERHGKKFMKPGSLKPVGRI